ncbi:hypothetical protein R3W88_019429 [Solanum pinnatisectum]|uniref:Uncharacterized protein n=1 Tax=Solanum pinnatisectum TaxID=50273 RepID=A0AAV9KKA3_9SOLN|nr:hypothetical protein R3W88_019429 [Solanum pinnatisectum]
MVKPSTNENLADPDVTSQPGPISSIMFERLFDGDLLVERGTKSKILATGGE